MAKRRGDDWILLKPWQHIYVEALKIPVGRILVEHTPHLRNAFPVWSEPRRRWVYCIRRWDTAAVRTLIGIEQHPDTVREGFWGKVKRRRHKYVEELDSLPEEARP